MRNKRFSPERSHRHQKRRRRAGHPLDRRAKFEALEQRRLLFGDPFYTAELAPAPFDLTLRLENDGVAETLQLMDSTSGEEIASAALGDITSPDTGNVSGVVCSGIENLAGAADNEDTLQAARGLSADALDVL